MMDQIRHAASIAMLAAMPHAAHASLITLAEQGAWRALSYETGGNAYCSAAWTGPSGMISISADHQNQSTIELSLVQGAWNWKPGTVLTATISFPGGQTQRLSGTGDSINATFPMDQATLPAWLHEFTARQRMLILIDPPANVPAWDVDLTGSTAIINAMSDCAKAHGFTNLPRPFMPADPVVVSAAPSSQPVLAQAVLDAIKQESSRNYVTDNFLAFGCTEPDNAAAVGQIIQNFSGSLLYLRSKANAYGCFSTATGIHMKLAETDRDSQSMLMELKVPAYFLGYGKLTHLWFSPNMVKKE